MKPIRVRLAAEQVADALRDEILMGRMVGEMAGVKNLAHSLGLNHKTVVAALQLLELEGLIISQGSGRPRRIHIPKSELKKGGLSITLLMYEHGDRQLPYLVEIRHRLMELGHSVRYASRSLVEMNMEVEKLSSFVASSEADAWLVVAGSRGILQFFLERKIPCFALFGNAQDLALPITGPTKRGAVLKIIGKLHSLGHSRIVLLLREEHIKPKFSPLAKAFVEGLEQLGVCVGQYHIPHWVNTPEGFQACLESIFGVTPPSALLVEETSLYFSVRHFLARRRIAVPAQVSLVCLSPHSAFEWCHQKVSHLTYNSDKWVRHVEQWVNGLSSGENVITHRLTEPDFVIGDSIGPAMLQ